MEAATIHIIDIDIDTDDVITIERIKEKYPNFEQVIKRGDLVENSFESGYRSTGVHCIDLINGKFEIIPLDYSYDDYGSVPIVFKGIQWIIGKKRK